MYDNVKYLGKTLLKWREDLHNLYSVGELYAFMQEGRDFYRLNVIMHENDVNK